MVRMIIMLMMIILIIKTIIIAPLIIMVFLLSLQTNERGIYFFIYIYIFGGRTRKKMKVYYQQVLITSKAPMRFAARKLKKVRSRES